MKRHILDTLKKWQKNNDRLPLLLRGARQVGKTYIIEYFGESCFESLLTINFEYQIEYRDCFNSLNPQDIINNIQAISRQKIIPGKTLLFLDEIQECPQAIQSLRYFKEQMPQLHVIGAGSLLEFILNDADFRMPVGRVQYIYIKPLSFLEYLGASGNDNIIENFNNINSINPLPEAIHSHSLKLVRDYTIIGGMPAAVQSFLKKSDILETQNIQSSLLNTYRNDFGKYSSKTNHKYLQMVYEKAPYLISQHIKYSKINPDSRAKDLKQALESLKNAGLISPVYSTSASGIPLNALENRKKFKLLFLDIGLVNRASKVDILSLMNTDLDLINSGALTEQFVGQELLAYQNCFEEAQVHFWQREARGSLAEVDYIMQYGANIIPIEVKAQKSGHLKSLRIFMAEKKPLIGVRISSLPLSFDNNILTVPFYLIYKLDQLIKIALDNIG